MTKPFDALLPSHRARWIWDKSDRWGYHYYLEARRIFSVGHPQTASLLITADAYYQVRLNGHILGQGPAKSASGTRSVDCHDLLATLTPGKNILEILVLSVGVGTMSYCPGEAGLLFELRLGSRIIGSDKRVQVRRSAARRHPTARRWILPCTEDVDAAARDGAWQPAQVVSKTTTLYPRRIPLPRRAAIHPVRQSGIGHVELPNFSVSYRIKRALVSPLESRLGNKFDTAATVRIPIISSRVQELKFTPSLGQMDWFFRGKKLFEGSGWKLTPEKGKIKLRLKAGRNELVGRHEKPNQFEEINLAGFVKTPVQVGSMEIARDDGQLFQVEPLPFANAHDLAVGAVVSPQGPVRRTIWDLGHVRNGWISFQSRGRQGQALMLAFFEAMEPGAQGRIQWPDGCNNALTYHLREGWQQFESFFPYGVRYIAVHEINGPVEWRNLHLLEATCTQKPQGRFQTDDLQFNGIYQIIGQSIESGTDDTFVDCPTFEQVNWNFDNRLASCADLWMTGNYDIIRNSILLFAEDPEHPGLVASQTPSSFSMPIPLWSLNWIFWCWDYYWHTGDLAFIRSVFPRIKAGLHDALQRIGSKGLMEFPGVWHFVEWSHGRDDDHAINAAEQAALLEALRIGGKLAQALGEPSNFAAPHAELLRAINRHLFCPAKSCYADSLHEDGQPSPVSSQATNAMMALYGAADAKWSQKLARDLALGRSPLLPVESPYGFYYILELMDRHGYGEEILAFVRKRWGEMLLAGDGTTWEVFAEYGHGSWPTRSRCHPFSAYAVKYLVKYILGVEILAPGFSTIRVKPRPPKNLNKGAGTIPTPKGLLQISWSRHAGKMKLDIESPPGMKVVRH